MSAGNPGSNANGSPAPASSGDGARLSQILDGRFRLESILGQGGMGVVYLAFDLSLDRHVAVKMLSEYAGAYEVSRLKREIAACAELDHENIVRSLMAGVTEDGSPYFVMEFVKGRTLKELLSESGRVNIRDAISIVRDVLRGLDAAHARGIIHRDIKPANVIVDETSGNARILDFGIARHQGESDQKLTGTGVLIGSAGYMSPEQCAAKPLDSRSDLYSLGCVLYEALEGKLPFEGASDMDTMLKHLHDEPPPAEKCPEQLKPVIAKALAKDPSLRYQSAREMIDALDAALNLFDSTVLRATKAPDSSEMRTSAVVAGVMIVVALGLLCAKTFQAWRSKQSPEPLTFGSSDLRKGKERVDDLIKTFKSDPARLLSELNLLLESEEKNPRVSEEERARTRLRICELTVKQIKDWRPGLYILNRLADHPPEKVSRSLRAKGFLLLAKSCELRQYNLQAIRAYKKCFREWNAVKPESLRRKTSEGWESLGGIGMVYMREEDYVKAGDYMQRAAELAISSGHNPFYVSHYLLYSAGVCEKLGEFAEAEKIYKYHIEALEQNQLRRAISRTAIEPGERDAVIDAYCDLAVFYFNRSRMGDARSAAKAASAISSGSVRARVRAVIVLAGVSIELADRAQAKDLLVSVLDTLTHSSEISPLERQCDLNMLVAGFHRLNEIELRNEAIRRSVSINIPGGDLDSLWKSYAMFLSLPGGDDIVKSLKSPNPLILNLARSRQAFVSGDFDLARALMDNALANPETAKLYPGILIRVYSTNGALLRREGKRKEAIEVLKNALHMVDNLPEKKLGQPVSAADPGVNIADIASAREELAGCCLEVNQPQEALNMLEGIEVLLKEERMPVLTTTYIKGEANVTLGRFDKGIKFLDRVLANPASGSNMKIGALIHKARGLRGLGKPALGLECLNQAQELALKEKHYGFYFDALKYSGDYQKELGLYSDAEQSYWKLLKGPKEGMNGHLYEFMKEAASSLENIYAEKKDLAALERLKTQMKAVDEQMRKNQAAGGK